LMQVGNSTYLNQHIDKYCLPAFGHASTWAGALFFLWIYSISGSSQVVQWKPLNVNVINKFTLSNWLGTKYLFKRLLNFCMIWLSYSYFLINVINSLLQIKQLPLYIMRFCL
jgi:hypothetical protein